MRIITEYKYKYVNWIIGVNVASLMAFIFQEKEEIVNASERDRITATVIKWKGKEGVD